MKRKHLPKLDSIRKSFRRTNKEQREKRYEKGEGEGKGRS